MNRAQYALVGCNLGISLTFAGIAIASSLTEYLKEKPRAIGRNCRPASLDTLREPRRKAFYEVVHLAQCYVVPGFLDKGS